MRPGNGLSGSWPPAGQVILVVDVVSAVLKCRALADAAATLLAVPSARALGAKYLGRIEAQPQIADSDLVLDSHAGSVGRRTAACDQRNKLLGSQRAAGRTGGNQISPALRLNLMETHRGPACRASSSSGMRMAPLRRGLLGSIALPRPLRGRSASSTLHGLPEGGAMFARLREMLDRWLRRRKRSSA
jgi:hypothetical protein